MDIPERGMEKLLAIEKSLNRINETHRLVNELKEMEINQQRIIDPYDNPYQAIFWFSLAWSYFHSADLFYPSAVRPIILLASPFFLFYTLPLKRQPLSVKE